MSIDDIDARESAAAAADEQLLTARLFGEADIAPGALVVASADVAGMLRQAVGFGRSIAIAEMAGDRACRICGCTEFKACEGACSWVGIDLCSSCAPPTLDDELQDLQAAEDAC